MNQYADAIKELGIGLDLDEVSRGLPCPCCGGGRTGEKKLYIKRTAKGYVYTCHRAKCELGAGFVGDKSYVKRGKPRPARLSMFDYYNLAPTRLVGEEYEFLSKKFRISKEVLYLQGLQFCERYMRVLIPIKTLDGKELGYVGRLYPELVHNSEGIEGGNCKTVDFYKDSANCAGLLVPKMYTSILSHLVLQEDFFSALRISQHVPCVALGGTNISDAIVKQLLSKGVKHLYICFDADATTKARKFARELGMVFDTHVIPLRGVDPKDMTEEELLRHVIDPIKKAMDYGERDTNNSNEGKG
jgi:hypothetical protein